MISSLSWHSSNKFDYAHLDSLKMLRHDNDQINLSLFIWLNRIFDKFGNSWTFMDIRVKIKTSATKAIIVIADFFLAAPNESLFT